MKTAAFVLISVWAALAVASTNYSAILYQQNSNRERQLFTLEGKFTSEGDTEILETQYKDLEGQIAVEEKSKLQGSKLLRYEIDQKQIGQQGIVEPKDGKIYFTKTVNGKSSTKEEKLQDTFVAAPNFSRFVKDNWETLSNGGTMKFRYAVWFRQETVGFELFKTGTEQVAGQEAVVLKLKPSSFIIAALVKPVIFKFTSDGSRLLELNGRVPVMKKDGSTYKDLDAEVVYSYAAAPTPAAPAPEATQKPAQKKSKK